MREKIKAKIIDLISISHNKLLNKVVEIYLNSDDILDFADKLKDLNITQLALAAIDIDAYVGKCLKNSDYISPFHGFIGFVFYLKKKVEPTQPIVLSDAHILDREVYITHLWCLFQEMARLNIPLPNFKVKINA